MLYFAAARERAGCSRELVELTDGASLGALVELLSHRHPPLGALWPHLRLAVDEAFVDGLDHPLRDGGTVALIPPVSGGAPLVALGEAPLDPRAVEALVAGPDRGAVLTFVGTVRDHTGEARVERLEYEAYTTMAERVLEAIRAETAAKWPGARIAVHHRLGTLTVGEAAVVIAVSAPHRAETFEACRHVIERLKTDVPIFKKEIRTDGSLWVGMGS